MGIQYMGHKDVSPAFKWNAKCALIAQELIRHQGTPEAIKLFAIRCAELESYNYWFFLSTLWVNYSGHSDLDLWRKLLSSDRPLRKQSIMKPSEMAAFERLPWHVTGYRAHRPGEVDWISYTLDPVVAARFARERGVDTVKAYRISRSAILAFLLRRGEKEIIVLDPRRAIYIHDITVVIDGEARGDAN